MCSNLTYNLLMILQFVKKVLASLPFSCQSESPSPYFDQSLFKFDEKVWFRNYKFSPFHALLCFLIILRIVFVSAIMCMYMLQISLAKENLRSQLVHEINKFNFWNRTYCQSTPKSPQSPYLISCAFLSRVHFVALD